MTRPGAATHAVSITIDVDGPYGLPHGGAESASRLTARSERLYGVERGVPRLLGVLAEAKAIATFYVPGAVAIDHPATVEAILAEATRSATTGTGTSGRTGSAPTSSCGSSTPAWRR